VVTSNDFKTKRRKLLNTTGGKKGETPNQGRQNGGSNTCIFVNGAKLGDRRRGRLLYLSWTGKEEGILNKPGPSAGKTGSPHNPWIKHVGFEQGKAKRSEQGKKLAEVLDERQKDGRSKRCDQALASDSRGE